MNTSKFIVVSVMVLAIAITLGEFLTVEAKQHNNKTGREVAASHQRNGTRTILTCNKSPKVCRLKGSSGRDCCRKRCVDLRTDKLNCGRCGKSCQYSEICCKGYCVNPMFDKRHCGGCFKKCNKGRFCAYGMCNYA